MRTFKKMRGIRLTYDEQGLVYFTCRNIKKQPQKVRDRILNLCLEIGGAEYYKALYAVLTTERSVRSIAMENCVSESQLYRLRKLFYEKWE